MTVEVRTTGPEETERLGEVLGSLLSGGETLGLEGPLGTGKTCLVRGLARGLGVSADEAVISPTFVLVREYEGRCDLLHCDAYRLTGGDDLLGLGLLEDGAERGAVVAIEWAGRVAEVLPAETWWVRGAHAGADGRVFAVEVPAGVEARLRAALAVAGLAGGGDGNVGAGR